MMSVVKDKANVYVHMGMSMSLPASPRAGDRAFVSTKRKFISPITMSLLHASQNQSQGEESDEDVSTKRIKDSLNSSPKKERSILKLPSVRSKSTIKVISSSQIR